VTASDPDRYDVLEDSHSQLGTLVSPRKGTELSGIHEWGSARGE